jgi:uncharacterized protein (TIGR02118 family)
MKLIALYDPPPDSEAFDHAYFETHMPLLEAVPGLQRTTITRFSRRVMGREVYMMAEMEFADWDSLKAGLNSPQMAAAGENLNSFAEGLVTLLVGETE